MVENLGYADFFLVTALIGLPTLLLIGLQWGRERRHANSSPDTPGNPGTPASAAPQAPRPTSTPE
ncbi:hypothetical protein D3C78_1900380 [compost metagenome]